MQCALKEAADRSSRMETAKDDLYLYTAFTMTDTQVQKFKTRFRETVLAAIDEAQDDGGNRVKTVSLTFM